MIKGQIAFTNVSRLILAIPHPINKHKPKGGVMSPIIRLITTTHPNMIGLIPNLLVIAISVGTVMSMIAVASMRQPRNNSKMLMAINRTQVLWMYFVAKVAMVCGIPSITKAQLKMLEHAIARKNDPCGFGRGNKYRRQIL